MEQDRMTCLVICRNLLLLVGNNAALLLCTDSYFDKRPLNIFIRDKGAILLRCDDRCLVQQILQIRSGESCGSLCELL